MWIGLCYLSSATPALWDSCFSWKSEMPFLSLWQLRRCALWSSLLVLVVTPCVRQRFAFGVSPYRWDVFIFAHSRGIKQKNGMQSWRKKKGSGNLLFLWDFFLFLTGRIKKTRQPSWQTVILSAVCKNDVWKEVERILIVHIERRRRRDNV